MANFPFLQTLFTRVGASWIEGKQGLTRPRDLYLDLFMRHGHSKEDRYCHAKLRFVVVPMAAVAVGVQQFKGAAHAL